MQFFGVAPSNKLGLKKINKFSSRNATNSRNTLDFSMSKTKLPQDEIWTMFQKIADFYFDEGENYFITFGHFR